MARHASKHKSRTRKSEGWPRREGGLTPSTDIAHRLEGWWAGLSLGSFQNSFSVWNHLLVRQRKTIHGSSLLWLPMHKMCTKFPSNWRKAMINFTKSFCSKIALLAQKGRYFVEVKYLKKMQSHQTRMPTLENWRLLTRNQGFLEKLAFVFEQIVRMTPSSVLENLSSYLPRRENSWGVKYFPSWIKACSANKCDFNGKTVELAGGGNLTERDPWRFAVKLWNIPF